MSRIIIWLIFFSYINVKYEGLYRLFRLLKCLSVLFRYSPVNAIAKTRVGIGRRQSGARNCERTNLSDVILSGTKHLLPSNSYLVSGSFYV